MTNRLRTACRLLAQNLFVITTICAGMFPLSSMCAEREFPTKPIRILVPLAAGGLTDIMTRVVGQKLTQAWGQPVVVDNRPGASGMIASDIVAKAAPDGHTLITVAIAHVVNVSIYPKLPYDTVRDFEPIIYLGDVPQILLVRPELKATTVTELINLAKATPGALNFSSGGIGGSSHMAMELFRYTAGIDLQHIPYKGGAQALVELVANRVELTFGQWVSAGRYIKSGQVRALGVSTPKRISVAPALPTIAESGLPGFESRSWYGMFGPARLPRPVFARLHGEISRIISSADYAAKFATEGVVIGEMSPGDFSTFVQQEIKRYAAVVKAANLKAN